MTVSTRLHLYENDFDYAGEVDGGYGSSSSGPTHVLSHQVPHTGRNRGELLQQ